ncbi:alpha-galactosidase [Enterococcus sp. JM4C]|uniref:alpha-galactosidase n=1 Tax=Candidatus Enterococcus huntleyi TaxID=1857217 RepID=UPI001EED2B6A|nr:alpha-galactosidase [Enterococcus sp. JM4C]KAF1296421.1 alpha-galactosidase [Enterococcus sp. JM4C]
MALIYVNQETLEFHLTNGQVSYIFRVMEKVQTLEQLYYGKAIRHREDFSYLIEREVRPSNNQFDGDHTSSLEHVKQELPVYGTTDFRYPALEITYPDGDTISRFRYQSYVVQNGKQKIAGQPTTFSKEADAQTLVIYLKDEYSDVELQLSYTIFKEYPVITRHATLTNSGQEEVTVNRLMSLSIDLPTKDYELLHLTGAWARETQVQREALHYGVQSISSTRGASSHVHNPFFALCEPTANEVAGEVFGFSLVYSGNFLGQIEVDTYEVTRLMLGINPFQFAWQLKAGDSFSTPEAVMVYSDTGLNGMSQTFHSFYQNQLVRPQWAHKERPILLNNWEATYFDFDEAKLDALIETAKELEIELFVLDDGWFGARNSDNSSLGNWTVDPKKLPNGLSALSNKIHKAGLKFGLWFEPEMVSAETALYEEHPEWLLGHPKKNRSHGRNQFVLDFGQPEAVEEIFRQMKAILDETPIDYLKWDMNRYISEAFSTHLAKEQQGEVFHRYILGVYTLYEKLLAAYPELLIESCAGGGGRFDPALLYYAPQTWASDDTDAVERLKIQYGASMIYPLSSIGSHVSEVPNHQVGRITSLKMRNDVATFGTFGYELDVTKLSVEQKAEIKQQVRVFKESRGLIHSGDFYRLVSPFHSNEAAWMVVSKDKRQAIVGYYQVLAEPNPIYKRLKLQGLADDFQYQVSQQPAETEQDQNQVQNQKQARYGDDLMNVGLIFGENYIDRAQEYWAKEKQGDFHSQLIYLKAIDEV